MSEALTKLLIDNLAAKPAEPVYAPACSEQGDNTYTHGCGVYEGHRHYAVCLKTIDRVRGDAPDRNAYDTACRVAITKDDKNCPAIEMRRKEIIVGKALYYIPRSAIGAPPIAPDQIFDPGFERGFRGPTMRRNPPNLPENGAAPVRKSRMAGKVEIEASKMRTMDGSNLHAELINTMVKDGK